MFQGISSHPPTSPLIKCIVLNFLSFFLIPLLLHLLKNGISHRIIFLPQDSQMDSYGLCFHSPFYESFKNCPISIIWFTWFKILLISFNMFLIFFVCLDSLWFLKIFIHYNKLMLYSVFVMVKIKQGGMSWFMDFMEQRQWKISYIFELVLRECI